MMIKHKLKHLLLLATLLAFSCASWAEYTEATVAQTSLENPITNWAASDDDTTTVAIGFDFPFGSLATVSQISINSNGALSLTAWSDYNNQPLATASSSTIIAPYWDDLNRVSGTIKYSTFGTAPNRRFVVGWDSVPRYFNNGSCTFQVVLYETGEVRFRYSTSSTSCNGNSATVGIQESNADFIQHSYNSAISLTQDLLYTPVNPPPPPAGPAIPLVVGSCDTFENNLDNWSVSESGGFVAIGTRTAQSPTRSLEINGGIASATSIVVDTSSNFKDITLWVRRGADSFSEDTDVNEDFIIEYLNTSNAWVILETFFGSGTNGQTYNRIYTMPSAAKHANFRLRLRMTQGNGGGFDFWHMDDVCLNPVTLFPTIDMQKTSAVISDGINVTNPKRIPGAVIEYDIITTNSGVGAADNNSITIADSIPANTALYVNDISGAGTGPIRFVDGSPPSGLSYSFTTLADVSDDVSFSSDGGSNFNYTPVADANGVDTSVTHVRMAPQGSLLATSGAGDPSFTLKFRVKVQ